MWCGQIFLAWSGIEIQSTSWIYDAIEMHSACQHVGKNLPMAGQNVVKISVKAGLARMMRPIFIWNKSCDVLSAVCSIPLSREVWLQQYRFLQRIRCDLWNLEHEYHQPGP